MESLHLGITSGKRGSAAAHSAYITRRGRHSTRADVIETGFGNLPPWANGDPNELWKASDRYERENGSTYRSFNISLPRVLTREQLKELAWEQAKQLAGSKPFQFALHFSYSSLTGEPNPHVHVVICDRLPDGIARGPGQTFKRYNPKHPEIGGCEKDTGASRWTELRENIYGLREQLANTINEKLERHGHSMRVDHRTLKARGIDRKPERYLGPAKIRRMSEEERRDHVAKRFVGRPDSPGGIVTQANS